MVAVFHFQFASFRFEVKRMAVFRFRFASFRFEAKRLAVFHIFFVLLSLCSIFVSLQISTFRIDAKQAKKALFSASKRKKISLPFRFISLRSENDGAPYAVHRCTGHVVHTYTQVMLH
jgi:hypothetical protein